MSKTITAKDASSRSGFKSSPTRLSNWHIYLADEGRISNFPHN